MNTHLSTRPWAYGGWLIGLASIVVAALGCSETPMRGRLNERTVQANLEQRGVQFETTTSHPVPFTLAPGSKVALLHDDRDETERPVRVALEQAVFSLKASIPGLIVVDRRSIEDLQKEFRFQASGLVRDQDLAKIGHFLGLDYVVVFDPIYPDLDELYGLKNHIDTWEVALPLKVIAVNSAEVKLHCLTTVKANIGNEMKATEVRLLNQKALGIAADLATQCLSSSVSSTAPSL